jgi:Family of unknown function (DUF6421)
MKQEFHAPAEMATVLKLFGLTNRIAATQGVGGAFAAPVEAAPLLDRIVDLLARLPSNLCGSDFVIAFRDDLDRWRRAGLDTPPLFDRARDAVAAPDNGAFVLFVGPVEIANGAADLAGGFQAFLARREEPDEVRYLMRTLPHPGAGCQNLRLIAATDGYLRGNGITFFPESVRATSPPRGQTYAMFFMDKFEHIYRRRTLPNAAAALGHGGLAGRSFPSAALSSDGMYRARCVWAYLHDAFHHVGARPLAEHLAVKTRFVTGALEELRVDARAILHLHGSGHPLAEPITEMILLERLLRYPCHPRRERNFDAATGLLLFAHLRWTDALHLDARDRLILRGNKLLPSLQALVEEIEACEALANQAYVAAAERLFRRLLPAAEAPARFVIPTDYCKLSSRLKVDRPVDLRTDYGFA